MVYDLNVKFKYGSYKLENCKQSVFIKNFEEEMLKALQEDLGECQKIVITIKKQ